MTRATVSIRDVAAAAGVSRMTVSRVLRNSRQVLPATRERVQAVVDSLGYRPNPLVRALMATRRRPRFTPSQLTLGFITSFPSRNGWRLPINERFFEGAVEAAGELGYRVEEFWTREPRMSSGRLSRILENRAVRGLLIAPLPRSLGHLRLDWERFAAVAFGYSLAWPELHRAANHQFRSMRMVVRRLRKLGYRRVGLALRSSIDERVWHHWMGAFLVEQQHVAPSERVEPLVVADRDWTRDRFARWFETHRPRVVLSQHDELLGWLSSLGVRVPEEAGFVHLNCSDVSGRVAGLYQNGHAVGRAAVDLLVSLIHRNERGIPAVARTVLAAGAWVDGDTLLQREPGDSMLTPHAD